ncbi:type I-U CRISPR-associated helicase/endonuclease Cas3 [Candidatus Methylacidiphilum fumarolicum]|nr:type I-U CRISPR-associated helicase/endonuclease Cas3 [Candidatus Methylacidiphilum fumarolicum]TFE75685.1 type I-U CRISPR-associated helicase/endonuclease Cas3 [Candidatus Methylacidiphilum fumarolicum]
MTGHEPYYWQIRLYEKLVTGEWEGLRRIVLPTGTGKTSLIPCYLLALANSPIRLPRRLVWIVNRRVVVDQASDDARCLTEKLDKPELEEVRRQLVMLSGGRWPKQPVAVSTLRGQLADNREWYLDPSRPAIIVGTVDMLGSRLIFRGYGCGPWRRAHHAGLLGFDSLIVLDEAHLEPAFDALLDTIETLRTESEICGLAPSHWIRMSATQRNSENAFRLEEDDKQDPVLSKKLKRAKRLTFVKAKSNLAAELKDQAIKLGKKYPGSRIVVFAKSPEDAAKAAKLIRKESKCEVSLLTGEIRGWERDRMTDSDTNYRRFTRPDRHEIGSSAYLVATSAGEVGADLYADHGVCDATTAESMLQRFGRIGRSGVDEEALIVIVISTKDEKDERISKTLEYLQDTIACNACLERIAQTPPPDETFREPPSLLILDRIILDALAATSVQLPKRLINLDEYLHGIEPERAPECHVAWRADVPLLAEASPEKIEEILDFYPVEPRELLRTTVDRLRKAIGGAKPELKCIVQYLVGAVEVMNIADLLRTNLRGAMILLPVEAGGFDEEIGCLVYDGGDKTSNAILDVADNDESEKRRRYLIQEDSDGFFVSIRLGQEEKVGADSLEEFYRKIGAARAKRKVVRLSPEDDVSQQLLAYIVWADKTDASEKNGATTILLSEHQDRVAKECERVAKALGLDDALIEMMQRCGLRHDDGKKDERWQKAAGNSSEKSVAKFLTQHGKLPFGFRHELYSVSDAMSDLEAHIIAAHHGWSRPNFPSAAVEFNPKRAAEADARFARLQSKYGHWGLAYLESILRAADALVSMEEQQA